MYYLIKNIEFIDIRNEFLDHLNKDIEDIKAPKNVFVFTDKSTKL